MGAGVALTILSYPHYFSLVKNSLDVLQQKSNDELISNPVEIKILCIIFNFSHVDIFVDFVYSVFYITKA